MGEEAAGFLKRKFGDFLCELSRVEAAGVVEDCSIEQYTAIPSHLPWVVLPGISQLPAPSLLHRMYWQDAYIISFPVYLERKMTQSAKTEQLQDAPEQLGIVQAGVPTFVGCLAHQQIHLGAGHIADFQVGTHLL